MEMSRNTDQTALITGATSGIGYELAKVCAQNGHDLILVARTQTKLDLLAAELREKFNITVRVIVKDLAVSTSAQEIAAELRQENIQVSILVNNAGFNMYGNF
jgi:short-subunit dehydrogenase